MKGRLGLRVAWVTTVALAGCATGGNTEVDSGGRVRDASADVNPPRDSTKENEDVIRIFGDAAPPPTPDGTVRPADANVVDALRATEGGLDGNAGDTQRSSPEGDDAAPHDATSDHQADAERDAPAVDAHEDAASEGGSKGDSAAKDAGPSCTPVTVVTGTGGAMACPAPTTETCAPGSTAGFSPSAPPPTAASQGKCTTAEMQAIYDGCLGPNSSNEACSMADPVGDCYACIFSDESDSAWGPVVSGANQIATINRGGCLALLEPCNAPCAATFEEDFECELAACEANCPTNTMAEIDAYEMCASRVDACDPGGCYSYSIGEDCESEITGPSHPGSVCFANPDDLEEAFMAIVPLFCGL